MENQFQKGEIVIYTSEDGSISLDTKLENDTIWLTQKQMAELFGVKTPAINKHLNNIYNEGELDKNATVSILEIVQKKVIEIFQEKLHFTILMQ